MPTVSKEAVLRRARQLKADILSDLRGTNDSMTAIARRHGVTTHVVITLNAQFGIRRRPRPN